MRMLFPLARALAASALVFACFGMAAPVSAQTAGAIVETHLGKAQGVLRNGVMEWRGLPFAEPPVGDLRWKAPLPARAWQGLRDASQFGAACPQIARYGITEGSDTEDCLTLNVSAPVDRKGQPRKNRPVLVWIHGGVFVGGSSSLYRLDLLARRGDVVVVSINYRIGALGFLSLPGLDAEANGAFGLADQRLALEWVQKNIAAFGGDPARVTIAGESAGAGSVCQHLVTPEKTKGLFHQAIMQSAGCLGPLRTLEQAQETTGRSMASDAGLGCADPANPLECLRKAPVAALLAAQSSATAQNPIAFFPSVGSPTLPRQASDSVAQDKIAKVPLINGGTRDELRLFLAYDVIAGKTFTDANLPEWIAGAYGRDKVEAILKAYPAKGLKPAERYGTMVSDYNPYLAINNCLYLHSANAFSRFMPVWEFEFADRNAPVMGVGVPKDAKIDFQLGAVHSSELNYLFPNLSNTFKIDAPDLAPASQRLADRMVDYWTGFVKTGVPGAKGAPKWPRYAQGGKTLWLEPGKIRLVDAWKRHHCDFWRGLYPERLGGKT